MKTTELTPVNFLKHTIRLTNLDIEIRLSDDCKNGHNDFAITGTGWTPGKPHIDKYIEFGGCCHEEILKRRPDLKIFVDLHLSDVNGAPMYAIANGFYHMQNTGKEATMDYLRINEREYDTLLSAKDQFYFASLLIAMQIPERWKKEAETAILKLEELTGQKFKDNSVKSNFDRPSDEKLKEIDQKIKDGYYSPEKIEEREAAEKEAAKNAVINKVIAESRGAIKKADVEFNVKMFILLSGLPLSNVIYYSHTNKVVFNWKDYDKKITRKEFEKFTKKAAKNKPFTIPGFSRIKLPENITFGFGEK